MGLRDPAHLGDSINLPTRYYRPYYRDHAKALITDGNFNRRVSAGR